MISNSNKIPSDINTRYRYLLYHTVILRLKCLKLTLNKRRKKYSMVYMEFIRRRNLKSQRFQVRVIRENVKIFVEYYS